MMGNILDPTKQESISKFEIVEEKNGVLKIRLVANSALQREIYESVYKKLAKNVEVEGFRKGHAPREMVEPKIYSQLADELVNQMAYVMVSELPQKLDKKYLIIGNPIVEKVDFKVVESPITLDIKVFVLTDKKVPDLKKYKVDFDEKSVKVTQDEIKQAIEQTFNEWKKQTKDSKFEKPTDEWIKSLKIPNVNTLSELEDYIKKAMLKDKIAREKIKLLEETLDKLIKDSNINLPEELIEKQLELAVNQKKQEVERFGISLEKYLEYYKKDLDSFKKELRTQVEKELKQEALIQIYIRQFNIELKKDDHTYLELAMSQLRVPPQAMQDLQVIQLVARLALTFKVFDDIAQKVGLGKVYASLIPPHSHDHAHDHGSAYNHTHEEDGKHEGKGSGSQAVDQGNNKNDSDKTANNTSNNASNKKSGAVSEILIADE